jgi:hypothetical protein
MTEEISTAWEYARAVLKYWWVIVVGLGLTWLDLGERVLGTWFTPPPWAKLTAAAIGLFLAQYLSYRDAARTKIALATEDEINAKLEADALRQGVGQLEQQIEHLKSENAKLRIKPYDQAQRQTVQDKLRIYSDTERDLLRLLLQRGETEGSLIYKASQDGTEFCSRALERLGTDGMVLMREDMSQPNVLRPRHYRVNPNYDNVLRDLLYPRQETQATPRFII